MHIYRIVGIQFITLDIFMVESVADLASCEHAGLSSLPQQSSFHRAAHMRLVQRPCENILIFSEALLGHGYLRFQGLRPKAAVALCEWLWISRFLPVSVSRVRTQNYMV